MKEYYFTFGQDHRQAAGLPDDSGMNMRNHWVRVTADSYMKARMIFIDEFSSKRMERGAACWSFQYEERDFEKSKHYFPGGEYKHLKQKS